MTCLLRAHGAAEELLRTALLAKLAVDLQDPVLARRAARRAVLSGRLLSGLDFPAFVSLDEEDSDLPDVQDLLDVLHPERSAEPCGAGGDSRQDAAQHVAGQSQGAVGEGAQAALLGGVVDEVRGLSEGLDEGADGVVAAGVEAGEEVRLAVDVEEVVDAVLVVPRDPNEAAAGEGCACALDVASAHVEGLCDGADGDGCVASVDPADDLSQDGVVAAGPDVGERLGHGRTVAP